MAKFYLQAMKVGFLCGLMDVGAMFASLPWHWRREWQRIEEWKEWQMAPIRAEMLKKMQEEAR